MQIHADFSRPVLVRTGTAEWVGSPLPGVDRLMLDRVGDEVARATSLVRYAPGSRFSTHTHDLGEEFLVLDGVFSDATGNFGPGSYVRNPPGSAHAPWSEGGCTIFVKLRQFDSDDRARVVVDTAAETGWQELAEGVEALELHRFGEEAVRMLRFGPAAAFETSAARGLELFVIDGTLDVEGTGLGPRDWLRRPAGGAVSLGAGHQGARVFVKSGHLATAQ